MNFNFTNTIKNKISSLQKADQKKTIKISDIVLIPEFEKMLAIDIRYRAEEDHGLCALQRAGPRLHQDR